jgi:hypothetical protein
MANEKVTKFFTDLAVKVGLDPDLVRRRFFELLDDVAVDDIEKLQALEEESIARRRELANKAATGKSGEQVKK